MTPVYLVVMVKNVVDDQTARKFRPFDLSTLQEIINRSVQIVTSVRKSTDQLDTVVIFPWFFLGRSMSDIHSLDCIEALKTFSMGAIIHSASIQSLDMQFRDAAIAFIGKLEASQRPNLVHGYIIGDETNNKYIAQLLPICYIPVDSDDKLQASFVVSLYSMDHRRAHVLNNYPKL